MEEIDLKEIFRVFWEKKLTIILLVAIFMVLGFIYSAFIKVPMYTSVTTLLLAQSSTNSEETSKITTADLTLNSNLISTYSRLLKSSNVVRQVISNLNIDDSEESIKKHVSVVQDEDTDIIKIIVTNADPKKASRIANEMAAVFSDNIIKEFYNIDNIHIVDEAEVDEKPSNINIIKDMIIFAFVGFILGAGYVFIIYMLDNSVKSQDDVERNIHVPVLANIPMYETEQQSVAKKKKQKSSKGGNKR